MKKNIPRVLVSHPGKQYVHQLCYALQKHTYLLKFITSIWYKPEKGAYTLLSWLPFGLNRITEKILKKKYFKPLREELIVTYPLYEFLRQVANIFINTRTEKWVFTVERRHDKKVADELQKYDPDIVIGFEKSSLSTFRQAKKRNKITILDLAQVHYTHIMYLRSRYPDMPSIIPDKPFYTTINQVKAAEYTYTDYIFTLSSYARQTLLEAGISHNKIYTLTLGFDPAVFKVKPVYNYTKPFRLLFAGQLSLRKGIRLILEAFTQLNLPGTELVLVGNVLDCQQVLAQYKGSYTHIPYLLHEELVKQYQQADILVFPSYLDSWAMTVLEAMACGTPVIVSENTGSKDAVKQGGGFIIPVDDMEALKEKIRYLYLNRQELERLGLEANRIAQQYTWENYYRQVKAAIDNIWERENTKPLSSETVPGL